MSSATMTSKGQITIPAAVRTALGVDTGDRVEFVEVGPGRFEFESLTAKAPGYVPTVVMVELGWVLESAYVLNRAQVVAAFEALLRAKEIVVEQAALAWKAVRLVQSASAEFADALVGVSAQAAGADRTVTLIATPRGTAACSC